LVDLACRKARDLGYPLELWTTRLLAQHAREHGPLAGHCCLSEVVQGTVCKILDAQDVKPRCATTWSAATRSLRRRWPRFCC
jgi:hypothetical protein